MDSITTGDAASLFLSNLSPPKRDESRQPVAYFVRWFGWDRPVADITLAEVERFAQSLRVSDTDYQHKLSTLRDLLSFIQKKGWTEKNLVACFRAAGKVPAKRPPKRPPSQEMLLTPEGERKLKDELQVLKERRPQIVGDMQRAAADKDFRENAPYHAAREQLALLDGRISEIEAALNNAVVAGPNGCSEISIGSKVTIIDLDRNEETCFTLVSPSEVDIKAAKISIASPLGKALLGKKKGDTIHIAAPRGQCRYTIKAIE